MGPDDRLRKTSDSRSMENEERFLAGFVESIGVWIMRVSLADQSIKVWNLNDVKLVNGRKSGDHRWLRIRCKHYRTVQKIEKVNMSWNAITRRCKEHLIFKA